jgi:hypothetical protein
MCNGRTNANGKVITGTNTLFFIPIAAMPKDRKATYVRIVCADHPEKEEQRRVHFTISGDQVNYPGAVSTKTADLTTAKILLNIVLSTPGAKYMTGDLKDFYLNTPMERYEYMRLPIEVIPPISIIEHNLLPLVHKGYVYAKVRRGMYGLPQAGRIVNDQLTAFLAPKGYTPIPITPGLWRHDKSDLIFTLVIDNFGIKYTNPQDVHNLMTTLKELYKVVSEDWMGGTSPTLDSKETKLIQEILGTLLYYARAVDSTMLATIRTIATQQASATKQTMKAIVQLLNYCATHPDAVVRYSANDMVLHVESDASYLSATEACSRSAGYHFLSDRPSNPPDPTAAPPKANGAVNIHCTVMGEVLASAAEAELAVLFHNGQEACP